MPKMLVVDDDIEIVVLVVAEARARGYDATGTIDPTEVLGRVRAHRNDIVVLDLQMGRHDGRDVLSRLKADAGTALAAVVVISALDDPHTIALCRSYGAADFVIKPFDVAQLFRRIEAVLATPRCHGTGA
jgi:DNA-binding response OmpR family regulator